MGLTPSAEETSAYEELWTAVVAAYESTGLIALTNQRDPSATTINTSNGQSAAATVVRLWPIYAEADYDGTSPQHVEVGKRACIAVLWARGGTSAEIAKVEWGEVFGDDGLISKVRKTGARSRQGPSSSSGVTSSRENQSGNIRGWSDLDSLPVNYMPQTRMANDG